MSPYGSAPFALAPSQAQPWPGLYNPSVAMPTAIPTSVGGVSAIAQSAYPQTYNPVSLPLPPVTTAASLAGVTSAPPASSQKGMRPLSTPKGRSSQSSSRAEQGYSKPGYSGQGASSSGTYGSSSASSAGARGYSGGSGASGLPSSSNERYAGSSGYGHSSGSPYPGGGGADPGYKGSSGPHKQPYGSDRRFDAPTSQPSQSPGGSYGRYGKAEEAHRSHPPRSDPGRSSRDVGYRGERDPRRAEPPPMYGHYERRGPPSPERRGLVRRERSPFRGDYERDPYREAPRDVGGRYDRPSYSYPADRHTDDRRHDERWSDDRRYGLRRPDERRPEERRYYDGPSDRRYPYDSDRDGAARPRPSRSSHPEQGPYSPRSLASDRSDPRGMVPRQLSSRPEKRYPSDRYDGPGSPHDDYKRRRIDDYDARRPLPARPVSSYPPQDRRYGYSGSRLSDARDYTPHPRVEKVTEYYRSSFMENPWEELMKNLSKSSPSAPAENSGGTGSDQSRTEAEKNEAKATDASEGVILDKTASHDGLSQQADAAMGRPVFDGNFGDSHPGDSDGLLDNEDLQDDAPRDDAEEDNVYDAEADADADAGADADADAGAADAGSDDGADAHSMTEEAEQGYADSQGEEYADGEPSFNAGEHEYYDDEQDYAGDERARYNDSGHAYDPAQSDQPATPSMVPLGSDPDGGDQILTEVDDRYAFASADTRQHYQTRTNGLEITDPTDEEAYQDPDMTDDGMDDHESRSLKVQFDDDDDDDDDDRDELGIDEAAATHEA
ncbi:uncharacterized protein BJ171DRAFT_519343 [Polychytrium aggregatum]|uniref:uncharacterized protein n=1 Tax=Polychytrium aggregatum TaxID=110093 RepID=UPI0022FDE53A|nr:uncharacterized protein BJ171DRAFT_519343 [Polychytrium aggregatum]KAI9199271.1 hypothetical protein BJ171DRAFT_519343 [Polychytrium aggregatum]